jgi:PleD family two-component response regulator
VTISIGLALSTEFTECTVEELMHQADMALYAAKAAGRNCVRVAQPSGIGKPAEEQAKETQMLTP